MINELGSVLLIDANEARRQRLEAVLSFLELDWQSGSEADCLAYLDASDNIFMVIVGELTKKIPGQLIHSFPLLPFLCFESLEESPSNLLGTLIEPVSYDQLTQLLHFCQSFTDQRPDRIEQGSAQQLFKLLVGRGVAIQEVRRLIEQVASKDANVLILGESGTGKEVIARAIHELSPRSKGPFVPINCGAIPGELLESELFGHEKGAFTGAFSARKGRFELAEGGTLFLDEIGDMPQPMQVKLLRVLQERTFERVGGGKVIRADVRIIAATHRDLEVMIRKESFREDLYYRLNVFPIDTPSLRERQDDIPLLLQELLRRHQQEHKTTLHFTQRALESLMQHPWPGNVRELSNLMERLLILHPGRIIDLHELPARYRHLDMEQQEFFSPEYPEPLAERDALNAVFQDLASEEGSNGFRNLPDEGMNLKEKVAEFEIEMIRQALDAQDGVVARACEMLGMRRTTLVEKMKKYGLSKE